MPRITAIKAQKHQNRVNIFLDDRYAFSLSEEERLKFALRQDQELSPDQVRELIDQGELSLIWEKTLRFLSYRPRSQREVVDYLRRKKVGEQTSRRVMAKLEEKELLDDRAFAGWWVEQRSRFRPKGKRVLALELKQKGVSPETIEEVLRENAVDEGKLALVVAQKQQNRLGKLPWSEQRSKLVTALLARGFGYEVAKEVVAKLRQKE